MNLFKGIRRCEKVVAYCLIGVFSIQFNTSLFGLPSAGSISDYWGYSSSGNNNLVGLSNGALNFSVPIASIPQYNFGVSYTSGNTLGKDAGMFGIGFSGFPGSINRSRMGLPDDLDGGEIDYVFSNQKNWSGSLGLTFQPDVLPLGEVFENLPLENVSLGLSASFTAGYNNYKGAFANLGLGAGLNITKSFEKGILNGISGNASLFGDVNFSSQEDKPRLSYRLTISLSTVKGLSENAFIRPNLGMQLSGSSDGVMDFGTFSSVDFYKVDRSKENNSSRIFSLLTFSRSKSIYAPNVEDSRFYLPSNPRVYPTEIKSSSFNLSVPIGGSISLAGSYFQANFGNETKSMRCFGYANLKNAIREKNENELLDFTIEGEDSYAWEHHLNQVPHMQYDNYSINASGIAGSFRYYQKEYGEVSRGTQRNQNRGFSLTGIETMRKESYPLTKMTRTSINKSVNILEALKKEDNADDKDFDNFFYKHDVIRDLKTNARSFGEVEPRMIGELAGDFSSGGLPYNMPFGQSLINAAPEKYEPRSFFMADEFKAADYYQDFSGEAKNHISNTEEAYRDFSKYRTTNIKEYKIGDLRKIAERAREAYAQNNDEVFVTDCFYGHYETVDHQPNEILNESDVTPLLLDEILSLDQNEPYFDKLIGGYEIENASGLKYFFTLPVFEKRTSAVSLMGKGEDVPVVNNGEYHSFESNGYKDRGKTKTNEKFWYPTSWLMTAIVGPDYIDADNIPGPSDGDIGYWVKFKYVKTSDDYTWRTPFHGMSYNGGDMENLKDESYSVSCGVKEVYYPYSIESSSHISKFNLFKRLDGGEAAGLVTGTPVNEYSPSFLMSEPNESDNYSDYLGDDFLYGVSSIDLYKKHDEKNISKERTTQSPFTRIRRTEFKYDYSSWNRVLNNAKFYSSSDQIPWEASGEKYMADPNSYLNSGKLTLKSVKEVIIQKNGEEYSFPPTSFDYHNGPEDLLQERISYVDKWGNFKMFNSQGEGQEELENREFNSNYCEIHPGFAKINAESFQLRSIWTPSGAEIQIDYGPKTYSSVQGKLPYVMRKIKSIESGENSDVIVKVDISDILDYCNNSGNENPSLEDVFLDEEHFVDNNKDGIGDRSSAKNASVYGEIGFYLRPDFISDSEIRVQPTEKMTISEFRGTECIDGRTYQTIVLTKTVGGESVRPFYSDLETYMMSESPHYRATKLNTSGDMDDIRSSVNSEQSGGETSMKEALQEMIGNVGGIFKRKSGIKENLEGAFGSIGEKIVSNLSYLRTPVYKSKFTGSVVKRIRTIDHFQFATDDVPGVYTTEYFYDKNHDGTGYSSGVCSNEQGIGKSVVNDVSKIYGGGFQTAPQIYMSEVTVKNGVLSDEYLEFSLPGRSRERGYTVNKFFAPDEPGYLFEDNFVQEIFDGPPSNKNSDFYTSALLTYIKTRFKIFGKKFEINIPFPIPLFSRYKQSKHFNSRSVSYVDRSDLFGKPKSISIFDENKNVVSKTKYNYFGPEEKVAVASSDFESSNITYKKLGSTEEMYSEIYETKNTKNAFRWLFLMANSKFRYVRTSVRKTYLPAILKSTEIYSRGKKQVVNNEIFHEFTGVPLQVSTLFPDGTEKINRLYPAFWSYPEMGYYEGGGSKQYNLVNRSISYLNEVSPSNVLSASFTNYHKDWKVTPNFITTPKKYSSDWSSFVYETTINNTDGTGETLPLILSGNESSIQSDGMVLSTHKWFRKEFTKVPKFDLDDNGLFMDFTFDSNSSNWLINSRVNYYSPKSGEVVEMQNIEEKLVSKSEVQGLGIPLSVTGNAPYLSTCFVSGEYYGFNSSNQKVLLESPGTELMDVVHFETQDCQDVLTNYQTKELNPGHFQNGQLFESLKLIFRPQNEGEGCTVNVEFEDGTKRILIFNKMSDGSVKAVTNVGEVFSGFFQTPIDNGAVELHFTKSLFNSFEFINQNNCDKVDFLEDWDDYKYCFQAKDFVLPSQPCVSDAHSGNHAFYLPQGTKGMVFRIPLDNYNSAIHNNVFEAKVWVHQSVAGDFNLVTKVVPSGSPANHSTLNAVVTPFSEARIESGDWKLFKTTYVLNGSEFNDKELLFYLDNQSDGIAIFDDFRINPAGSGWGGEIYDLYSGLVNYQINENHFSTMTLYDDYLRLKEIRQEVESIGFVTVQRKRYGFQIKE